MNSSTLHVGFVCNEYPGIVSNGGIGSFTQSLGEKLVARGHAVTVFGVYKQIDEKIVRTINGVRVLAIPYTNISKIRWEYNRWRLMRLVKSEHKRNSLSLIEVPDYQGWLRNSSIKVPKIIRIHSPQKVGLDPSIDPAKLPYDIASEEKSFDYADYICAVGKSVAAAARKTYLKSLSEKTPIDIIYNGINTGVYRPKESEIESGTRVVFAGRLTEKKGVLELAKAWPKIAHEFPVAQLVLAGRDSQYGVSGSMISEINNLIPEEFRNSIVYSGFLDAPKVLDLFQNATICIFPSHREAFSIVILEAMATGKPVVYSKIGPGYEIIEDGVNGALCDPHDPDDIARIVINLLSDNELLIDMGIKAREHVVQDFSLEHMVNKNIEYFESCIQKYQSGE